MNVFCGTDIFVKISQHSFISTKTLRRSHHIHVCDLQQLPAALLPWYKHATTASTSFLCI